MAIKAVRLAVKNYFDNGTPFGAVPGLAKVHRAKPRNWVDTDFALDASTGIMSSSVAYPYFEGATESRIATGEKRIDYVVALIFQFRSWHTDADDAIDDFDDLVDAIKARVRADKRFGTGGTPIWQAGEHTLEHASEATQYEVAPQQKLLAFVRFDVTEMILA